MEPSLPCQSGSGGVLGATIFQRLMSGWFQSLNLLCIKLLLLAGVPGFTPSLLSVGVGWSLEFAVLTHLGR